MILGLGVAVDSVAGHDAGQQASAANRRDNVVDVHLLQEFHGNRALAENDLPKQHTTVSRACWSVCDDASSMTTYVGFGERMDVEGILGLVGHADGLGVRTVPHIADQLHLCAVAGNDPAVVHERTRTRTRTTAHNRTQPHTHDQEKEEEEEGRECARTCIGAVGCWWAGRWCRGRRVAARRWPRRGRGCRRWR